MSSSKKLNFDYRQGRSHREKTLGRLTRSLKALRKQHQMAGRSRRAKQLTVSSLRTSLDHFVAGPDND